MVARRTICKSHFFSSLFKQENVNIGSIFKNLTYSLYSLVLNGLFILEILKISFSKPNTKFQFFHLERLHELK